MASGWKKKRTGRSLGRLFFDIGGNTLVIMAMALLPLSALAGSAVDMARLYVVKVRLQQACDAGALAGRKFMVDSTLDDNAKAQATNFFKNNFTEGWFETTAVSFTPSLTMDSQVSGTASATVPMVVMQAFGKQPVTLNVTCQARLEIADVDVMFVLDTTGSMACAASESSCTQTKIAYTTPSGKRYYLQEKSSSKIVALRQAVNDFYTTLTSAADPSTHMRFGFVPYTSTVNVGYIIPSNYMISGNYTYQSRHPIDAVSSNNYSAKNVSQTDCNKNPGTYNYPRTPATGWPATARQSTSWTNSNGGTCNYKETGYTQSWRYQQETFDVGNFVTGASVTNPAMLDGSKNVWQGCIEERPTTASSSFNQNSLPSDLDIDLPPTSDATRWRPMWPEVIFNRSSTPQDTTATNASPASDANLQNGYMTCGQQAQRLTTMTASDIAAYVNGLRVIGGTYHDTGMLWGSRFISPTGPFANDTAPWPNRNPPSRNIIFMTDGDMDPDMAIYGLYGYEQLDHRVGATSDADQKARHNARFSAICEEAKSKNITVWVVAYAQVMTTELQNCASPNKAYYASNDAALKTAFKTIASQIAELRLSK
jgi:Flp pilus assembly protein TadG